MMTTTLVMTGTALAAITTYSVTKTIPAPPASSYAGSGGGDGWDLSLSADRVFNVFHHNGNVQVACHLQSNAAPCSPNAVNTITGPGGASYSASSHSGTYLDVPSGKLWVYAVRNSDGTAGVVCVDTTIFDTSTNPFCGFTALSAVGDGGTTSTPMRVGNHLYAFNYFNGAVSGDRDKLLCFDLSGQAACAGQPFTVDIGGATVSVGSFPSPAAGLIGDQLLIPVNAGGVDRIACFDDSLAAECATATNWPISASASSGAPFEKLDSNGVLTGFCLPSGSDPCWDLTGASVATPAGLASVMTTSNEWNGKTIVLGARVYVVNGNNLQVQCFDYASGATCTNFPRSSPGMGVNLYSINTDWQRPTCFWINGDSGSGQIQNFDAYTGGACGEGPIRLLAGEFVSPAPECVPTQYTSLQVLDPAPGQYSTGSVDFRDGNGDVIPGLSPAPLDSTGTADITGLNPYSGPGLPQFLITLNNPVGTIGSVTVEVTWSGQDVAGCAPPGTNATISGTKYYDANANGKMDNGETGIANWPINYSDGTTAKTAMTDANGAFAATVPPGTYAVAEQVAGSPWMQTGNLTNQSGGTGNTTLNSNKTYSTTLTAGETASALNFGNLCLGGGGSGSKGFWTNKNGQAVFATNSAGALAALTALNLVNANGSAFDPTSYNQVKTWLNNATSTNAAYMLSAQLAAMKLNVFFGMVNGSALIYAPGTSSANANGFATVNAIMTEANTSLGSFPNTTSGTPGASERPHQTTLSSALDAANNNTSFVQPTPATCPAPVFPVSP